MFFRLYLRKRVPTAGDPVRHRMEGMISSASAPCVWNARLIVGKPFKFKARKQTFAIVNTGESILYGAAFLTGQIS